MGLPSFSALVKLSCRRHHHGVVGIFLFGVIRVVVLLVLRTFSSSPDTLNAWTSSQESWGFVRLEKLFAFFIENLDKFFGLASDCLRVL